VRFFKSVRLLSSGLPDYLGVENGKEQLGSINISDIVDDIFAEDTIADKAPYFHSTLGAIVNLVQNSRTNADGTKTSPISDPTSSSAVKRPAEVGMVEESTKRTKVLHKSSSPKGAHTPDQPTVVPNPNYSGSTDSSGESIESTDEELTRTLLRNFLDDARVFLRLEFRILDWTKSGLKTDLAIRYCTFSLLCYVDDRTHTTRFRLGVERITARNDGGLSIRYEGSKIWGGDRMPVLSLEVFIHFSSSNLDL
jgi:hypothetical protein